MSQLQRLVSTGIRGCPGVGKPHTHPVSGELRGRAKSGFFLQYRRKNKEEVKKGFYTVPMTLPTKRSYGQNPISPSLYNQVLTPKCELEDFKDGPHQEKVLKRKGEIPDSCLHLPVCEDTVRRQTICKPRRKFSLPAPWSWISRLSNCEK